MTSPTKRSYHEERSREAFRSVQDSTVDSSRRWYRHQSLMFIIPLIVLQCFPRVYNILVNPSSATHRYNVAQLQEVAALIDDIYTTLANLTFIPHTAIKRGPHELNISAIPCERDPAVLRLMEILPYVDSFEVEEPRWLSGSHFMDYRRHDHLQEGCDPLRKNADWDYMTPQTLAFWGTSGWNGDRTFVPLYDTIRHAISIYEGDEWITRSPDGELEDSVWAPADDQGSEWFNATTLLQRMLFAYQFPSWSPWDNSNLEGGFGVDPSAIKHLIRRNGWPQNFHPDQFNVDLIRAKHKPSGKGYAEDAFKRIKELQGVVWTADVQIASGSIFHTRDRLARLEEQLINAIDDEEKWLCKWRVQRTKWDLGRDEADLKEVKTELQRLCPTGICYDEEEDILWEFRALEKNYEKAKFDTNATSKCQKHAETLPTWAPPNPDRLQNCVAQLEFKAHWLFLAYSQSKAEALEYCAKTSSTLLPSDTLENGVRAATKKLERDFARAEERLLKMVAWEHNLPVHATKAVEDFRIWESAVSNERWYIREKIEWLEGQLTEGGDKGRLWRCLDDPECI